MTLRELKNEFLFQEELQDNFNYDGDGNLLPEKERRPPAPMEPGLLHDSLNIQFYMLASIFRELKERKLVESVEDLGCFELCTMELENNEEVQYDLGKMTEIYLRNYRNYPELQEVLENAFNTANEDGIKKQKRVWYEVILLGNVLGKEQSSLGSPEIIAFCQFQNMGRDSKGRKIYHFGAMNVSPDLRGSFLGEALMESSLSRENNFEDNAVIKAECDLNAPVTQYYLNKAGFAGTKITRDFYGISKLDIISDPN